MNFGTGVREAFAAVPSDTFPNRLWNLLVRTAKPQISRINLGWSWSEHTQNEPSISLISLAYSDGSMEEVPELGELEVGFYDGSALSVFPELDTTDLAWALVEGGYDQLSPEMTSSSVAYSDGTNLTAFPYLYDTSIAWSMSSGGPSETEKVLFVSDVSNSKLCTGIRVVGTLADTYKESVRILVRTDLTELSKTVWSSYQVGEIDNEIVLKKPGYIVQVGIVADISVPNDVDFNITFIRE